MGILNIHIAITLVFASALIVRADAGLPDPTRPADYSVTRVIKQALPGQRTIFSLNAIRISETDRSAIINGMIVRVGDEISNARVKEINAVEVILDYERKLLTVPLYAREISKQYKTSKD